MTLLAVSKILTGLLKKLFLLFEVLMIVYHKRSKEAKFDLKNLLEIMYHYFIVSKTCEIEYLGNVIKVVCNFFS